MPFNFSVVAAKNYGRKMLILEHQQPKILFKGKLEQKENSLQATLWRKNFLNIVNYKFGNSQNEFIADEVFTGKPQNHHSIWVFDREISK